MMLSGGEREHSLHLAVVTEENAKKVIKPGDPVRVHKCSGRKRWITFREWDGAWIVSSRGINDFSLLSVDNVN